MVNNYGTGKIIIKNYDIHYLVQKMSNKFYVRYFVNDITYNSLVKVQCYLETFYN